MASSVRKNPPQAAPISISWVAKVFPRESDVSPLTASDAHTLDRLGRLVNFRRLRRFRLWITGGECLIQRAAPLGAAARPAGDALHRARDGRDAGDLGDGRDAVAETARRTVVPIAERAHTRRRPAAVQAERASSAVVVATGHEMEIVPAETMVVALHPVAGIATDTRPIDPSLALKS